MNNDEYGRMRDCEENHWWFRALHRYLLRFIPETREPKKALDIGAGTGGLMLKLRERGYACTGVDLSPLAVESLRERGFVDSRVADANSLPFAENSFDLITCIDIFECEEVDPPRAIAEAVRVLKPGGQGIFQMPAHQWLLSEHDRAIHSVRRLNLRQFKALFDLPEIRIEKATYFFCFLFPLMAAWKLLNPPRDKPRDEAVSDVTMPNAAVNALLSIPCWLESRLLPTLPLPMGTSVCAVIRKI